MRLTFWLTFARVSAPTTVSNSPRAQVLPTSWQECTVGLKGYRAQKSLCTMTVGG